MARSARSGRRTDYQWAGGTFSQAAIAETNLADIVAVFNAAGTVVRARGEIIISLDGPADGDKKIIGLGLKIMSDDQAGGATSSMASPITDADADWWWHAFVPLQSQSATQDQALGDQVARVMVDTKAMRKVKQNQNVVLVVDGLNVAGTPIADLTGGIRVLFAS